MTENRALIVLAGVVTAFLGTAMLRLVWVGDVHDALTFAVAMIPSALQLTGRSPAPPPPLPPGTVTATATTTRQLEVTPPSPAPSAPAALRALVAFACLLLVLVALVACAVAPPPMPAVDDPVANGNMAAQEACVRDTDAGPTIAATKAAIDACRCRARNAHGVACDAGAS